MWTNSVAVIAQSFFHNWEARVNGERAPLLRANHAFQGLELPAGESVVELAYVDKWFRTGLWITGTTMLMLIIVVLSWKKLGFRGYARPASK